MNIRQSNRAIAILWTLLLSLLCAGGCDIHEFPDIPEKMQFHLRLKYETGFIRWYHVYEKGKVTDKGTGDAYDNMLESGDIRYFVRAFQASDMKNGTQTEEFMLTRKMEEGYDCEYDLGIPSGDYSIMIWSDLSPGEKHESHYDCGNFSGIFLNGPYRGSDDYKDAFRGAGSLSLMSDYHERKPDTLDISMQRPLAKYEFITTDLDEFIDKEQTRLEMLEKSGKGGSVTTRVNIDNYKVAVSYVGFMPDTYNMFTDKPVDSSLGVIFESGLKQLDEGKASLGFDYVFVNGTESKVTVKIGLYDEKGTLVSMTEPIEVPLKRNHHTIIQGGFLTSKASGGVSISPDYNGDYNLVFPLKHKAGHSQSAY